MMDGARDLTATTDVIGDPSNPHRRRLLECMVWAGAGVLWTMSGGVPRSSLLGSAGGLLGSAAAAVLVDDGKAFFERFTPGAARGWYSWDQQGVHFVALNNVQDLKAGALGNLGIEQLKWLDQDLAGRAASQPIVVFAHVPLWTMSAEWGWGTGDGAQALMLLRRFGSVTVLNGHIHQVMQKVEGNVAFHTPLSTAFPQPAPGTAPSPGPIKDLPAGKLRSMLGITQVAHVPGGAALALVDTPLGTYDGGA